MLHVMEGVQQNKLRFLSPLKNLGANHMLISFKVIINIITEFIVAICARSVVH